MLNHQSHRVSSSSYYDQVGYEIKKKVIKYKAKVLTIFFAILYISKKRDKR